MRKSIIEFAFILLVTARQTLLILSHLLSTFSKCAFISFKQISEYLINI